MRMDLVGLCAPSQETRYQGHSPPFNTPALIAADRFSAHRTVLHVAHLRALFQRNYPAQRV